MLPLCIICGLLALCPLSAGLPHKLGSARSGVLPLRRRSQHARRSSEDLEAFALSQANRLRSRYGDTSSGRKRSSPAAEVLSDLNGDSQYFGTIEVGTPAKAFYIVMDTGSADLWIVEPDCTGCPSGSNTYLPSSSSTSMELGTSFSVTYGSGQAIGELVEDTVTMAGYSVSQQTFASVNTTTGSLLTNPNAGISEFGFALTRFQNDSTATVVEPGGIMVINGVNSSLYTGSINYVPLASESFWLIPLDGVTVSGKTVLNSTSATAIDTGTTLIGGPSTIVAEIYAAIPNSAAQSGSYAGYYTFPCSSNFTVSLTFGGEAYSIASEDFNLGPLDSSNCLGAIFAVDTTAGQPAWIVGDSFLKSYYTTFRADPAAVGFASLSSAATMLSKDGLEASLTTSGAQAVSSSTALRSTAHGRTTMLPSFSLLLSVGVSFLMLLQP